MWTRVLYSAQWKRKLKFAYVQGEKGKYVLLTSNDMKINGLEMYWFYSKRFQIKFIFRDTKQYLGLFPCQSRKKESLTFHFNFSFLTYNLCQVEHLLNGEKSFFFTKPQKRGF